MGTRTVLHTSPGHAVLKGNATPLLFKIQHLIKGLSKLYFLFDNALQRRPCLGEGEKKVTALRGEKKRKEKN